MFPPMEALPGMMLFLVPAWIRQGLTTQVAKGSCRLTGMAAALRRISQAGRMGSDARSGREPWPPTPSTSMSKRVAPAYIGPSCR